MKRNEASKEIIQARVTEVHPDIYKIKGIYGEALATRKGTLVKEMSQTQNVIAVGDIVTVNYNMGQPVIYEIMPRKSKFSRPDYLGHHVKYVKTIVEQVIAANFDYVFIMCSLNQELNIKRVQRYLAAAWQSGGIPVIILTKTDLCKDYTKYMKQIREVADTVDVIAISSLTREGLDGLKPYLGGKTIVFLGSSGVGKSTLVNALADENIMDVKEIREDDSKGRHTTTHRQLITLKDGTMIIDTPGMRELSLWEASEGLDELFFDVKDYMSQCQFSNCSHKTEEGCAVKAAIESGNLSEEKWNDYLKLERELRFTNRKAATTKKKQNLKEKKRDWRYYHEDY